MVRMFSLVLLVWESNPKVQGDWHKARTSSPSGALCGLRYQLCGYDRSATLDNTATLDDATRDNATHDDPLPTPTTTQRLT
jgi:hypothetical protein